MTATVGAGRTYWCTAAGYARDLKPGFPDGLKIRDDDNLVESKGSCKAYNTYEYCCCGALNDLILCWNVPSTVYFKSNFPGAYGCAYGDGASTLSSLNTDYFIISE
jgi:hypothetical protein